MQGKTGDNLLQILESRLDNVVYRAGLARTRRQARQFVVHGHFLVNGHKVNIPSYRVSAHDVIDSPRRCGSRRRTSSPARPTASATCRPGCRSLPDRVGSWSTSSRPASRS